MPVTCQITDHIALITIDNPPVNVLSRDVRQGLVAALDEAEAAGARRIIVAGAGRAFVAGADAKEFDAPPVGPHLPEILARLEKLPAIAAINGTALGGGLEIALAARVRIAHPKAVVGLPEVILGVIPGAGGTQRLPRLIGIDRAVGLIAEGRSLTAVDAEAAGIVDLLAEDPVAAARALPEETFARHRPISDLPAPLPAPEAVAAAHTAVAKRMAGQVAPLRAIALIEATVTTPLAQGLLNERAVFLELRSSDQAAALRHVFFAERAAMARGKAMTGGRDIVRALVVGAGALAADIAKALAAAGIAVQRVDPAQLTTLSPTECAVDLAIEAAEGRAAGARATLAALADLLSPQALLATSADHAIAQITAGIGQPERLLALAFCPQSPKLLEVIRLTQTAPEAVAAAFRLAERLRKIPVEVGPSDAAIRWHMHAGAEQVSGATQPTDDALLAMIAAGFDLLAAGIAHRPSDIDLVMVHSAGVARGQGGPMHSASRIGLALVLNRLESLHKSDPQLWHVPDLLRQMVAENRSLASLD